MRRIKLVVMAFCQRIKCEWNFKVAKRIMLYFRIWDAVYQLDGLGLRPYNTNMNGCI